MTSPLTVTPRQARVAAWTFAVLVVAAKVVVMLSGMEWRASLIVGDTATYFVPMLVSIALAGVLAWRSRATAVSEVFFWSGMGAAVFAVLVSEVHWTYYTVAIDSNGPPAASWTRGLHAVAVIIMFLVLMRVTRFAFLPLLQRLCYHIDVASLLVVAWPLVYAGWTLPLIDEAAADRVIVAGFAAAYPLLGFTLMSFTTLIIVAWIGKRRAAWEGLAAASLWTYGATLASTPFAVYGVLDDPVAGSNWLTLALTASVLLLIVSMVYRLTATGVHSAFEPWPLPRALSARALRFLPLVASVSLPVMVFLAFRTWGSPLGGPLLGAAWALAALLALRSLLSAVERAGIRASAQLDPASGLFNRETLGVRLAEVVEYSGEMGEEMSIAVFDVWPLRPVRGSGETLIDDQVTRAFARLVAVESEVEHQMFRVAGDRFAILLEGTSPARAVELALRVWLASGKDSLLAGLAPDAGVYAGVASYPRHALDAEALLAAAELAVSAAHGVEGEPVVVFGDDVLGATPDEHASRERLRVQRSTVRTLAEAVDARDPATRDHSANVAELATALAQVLGLSDRQVQMIGLGALMHDVGKIGVSDDVLLKDGLLDDAEQAEVQEHSALGERILAPARLDEILPLVRSHHERWDGTGYPDGLRGEQTPIEARVVAVCDAFETMTTGRPYRCALSTEDALTEIEACAGTQLDPQVAAAFIRMIRGLAPHERGVG